MERPADNAATVHIHRPQRLRRPLSYAYGTAA
jgi:hypothetical protein